MSTKLTSYDQLKKLAQRTKAELNVLDSKKQDILVFGTTYNATTNKVATMQDVDNAVAGLSGAMHLIGTSTQDPTHETTVGTQDGPVFSDADKSANPALESYTAAAGDVVTFGKKEFLFDGSKWREYGDEGDYAIKGAIKNADIAADAAIDQSKIANLGDSLNGKVDKETGKSLMLDTDKTKLDGISTGANKVEASATPGNVKIDGTETPILGEATASTAGMMSAGDKSKLDGMTFATDTEVDAMLDSVFGSTTPTNPATPVEEGGGEVPTP